MSISIILFRLSLSLLYSSLIGYEREVSESTAGIKTHILVAIGSTIIALLQIEIIYYVQYLAVNTNGVPINVSADASRLVAQIVSGIGFLGAGTIIVTKTNISGLTTAASIWTVAAVGIALGMGFYEVATCGFLFAIMTLFIFKRVIKLSHSYRIIVRYIGGADTLTNITDVFTELSLKYETVTYRSEMFSEHTVHENIFKITELEDVEFKDLIAMFSTTKNIVSVERTNLY